MDASLSALGFLQVVLVLVCLGVAGTGVGGEEHDYGLGWCGVVMSCRRCRGLSVVDGGIGACSHSFPGSHAVCEQMGFGIAGSR